MNAIAEQQPKPDRVPALHRPGTLTVGHQLKRTNLLRDAHEAERLMMDAIRNCPQTVEALTGFAGLVRSFVALVDCIQRLRGIPTPGQLRPDLDPVQIARMLKRAKSRQPIDLAQIGNGASKFYDEPEPLQTKSLTADPKIPLNKPPIKESKKESLSDEADRDRDGGGGGAKTDGGSL